MIFSRMTPAAPKLPLNEWRPHFILWPAVKVGSYSHGHVYACFQWVEGRDNLDGTREYRLSNCDQTQFGEVHVANGGVVILT